MRKIILFTLALLTLPAFADTIRTTVSAFHSNNRSATGERHRQGTCAGPRALIGCTIQVPGMGEYLVIDVCKRGFDLWMPSRRACIQFGRKTLAVTVIRPEQRRKALPSRHDAPLPTSGQVRIAVSAYHRDGDNLLATCLGPKEWQDKTLQVPGMGKFSVNGLCESGISLWLPDQAACMRFGTRDLLVTIISEPATTAPTEQTVHMTVFAFHDAHALFGPNTCRGPQEWVGRSVNVPGMGIFKVVHPSSHGLNLWLPDEKACKQFGKRELDVKLLPE